MFHKYSQSWQKSTCAEVFFFYISVQPAISLRTHWKLSTIFKASKNMYKVMFFDMFKYIYSSSLFNTICIEIKHKYFKKFASDKVSATKNAPFFLSWAPTHHSFTFNLRFLHDFKHKVRLSNSVCGIFHFRIQKPWTLWL